MIFYIAQTTFPFPIFEKHQLLCWTYSSSWCFSTNWETEAEQFPKGIYQLTQCSLWKCTTCINTLQNSFVLILAVLSNIMSWVGNQRDSWNFHGKHVQHSSSLHKVMLYGTLFKGKLLTGEAGFPRQIKSSLNNHWQWMINIQNIKLSKFFRPPSQDFTD